MDRPDQPMPNAIAKDCANRFSKRARGSPSEFGWAAIPMAEGSQACS